MLETLATVCQDEEPAARSETDVTHQREIVLVMSADDGFAMPLSVAVYSAAVHLRDGVRLRLFLLDGGISPWAFRLLSESLRDMPVSIHRIVMDRDRFASLPLTHSYSQAVYYRLAIGEVLPEHIDRILYLDCDVVVREDLWPLWVADLGPHQVLAAQDGGQPFIGDVRGLRNYRDLGLDPGAPYFNSGVMVIDLQAWRRNRTGERAIRFLKENMKTIVHVDQDALNALLVGCWGKLDPLWNQMAQVHFRGTDWWMRYGYDERIVRQLVQAPKLVHYTGSKPWTWTCRHPQAHFFHSYRKRTAWTGPYVAFRLLLRHRISQTFRGLFWSIGDLTRTVSRWRFHTEST